MEQLIALDLPPGVRAAGTLYDSRNRWARSSLVGRRKGTPEALMVCLARLIRWAIVASGTRNALAISAVVNPPTARNVRAMADDEVSELWQHMKSRMRVSS